MADTSERRFNFTQAAIRDLEHPETGEVDYYDAAGDGLICRVTAPRKPRKSDGVRLPGKKTYRFYLWSRLHNRPVKKKIGSTDRISVDAARKEARRLAAEIDRGNDPNEEFRQKQSQQQVTLAALWDAYRQRRHPQCRPSTIRNDVSMWERHILGRAKRPTMKTENNGPLPVGISNYIAARFTSDDAAVLHAKLTAEIGGTTADEVLGLLHRLYSFSGITPNPCKRDKHGRDGIKANGKTKLVRYLTVEAFQKLMAAIDSDSDQEVADLVRVALFTGQRRDNVRTMRWDEVDMHLRVWIIPAAKFKTNKQADTPLPKPALEVLRRRHASREKVNPSPYVFPSRADSLKPRTMIDRQVRRIFKRAGLADWRFHDLRHACASAIIQHGGTLAQAGRQLNHANAASTERYAHLDAASVAAVADDAFAMLATKPKAKGKAKN